MKAEEIGIPEAKTQESFTADFLSRHEARAWQRAGGWHPRTVILKRLSRQRALARRRPWNLQEEGEDGEV